MWRRASYFSDVVAADGDRPSPRFRITEAFFSPEQPAGRPLWPKALTVTDKAQFVVIKVCDLGSDSRNLRYQP